MGIGKRLRALRERACLTQEQLAVKIGVTPAAVGNYEHDVSFPRGEVMFRLFRALECEPNELFEDHYTESGEDAEHLRKYRELDGYGKELVDACTDIEYRRCNGEPQGVLIAARGGGAPRRIPLKKRLGAGSILDAPDYNGGHR